jgi:hypothetical protein
MAVGDPTEPDELVRKPLYGIRIGGTPAFQSADWPASAR